MTQNRRVPGTRPTDSLSDTLAGADADSLSRWLVEASPDGLWVFDSDGRTVLANSRMARMLGRTSDEMPGLSVFETLDGAGQDQFALHLEDLQASQEPGSNLEC